MIAQASTSSAQTSKQTPSSTDTETSNISLTLSNLNNAIQEGREENITKYIQELHRYWITDVFLQKLYHDNRSCLTLNDLIHTLLKTNNMNINKVSVLQQILKLHFDNPYMTEDEVNNQRTETFYQAIQYKISNYLLDSNIIEILYDYWCNKIHWADTKNNNIINNIKRVGKSLEEACSRSNDILIQDQQLLVDCHCLKKINEFQNELYSKLKKLQINPKDDVKAKQKVILTILRTYNEYSCISKIRLPKLCNVAEQSLQMSLSNPNNKYERAMLYIMYEMYFRKLDYNVSLLIVDYLVFLKTYLDYNLYKNLESSIYYFIYRANENWRLYLPTSKSTVIHKHVYNDNNSNNVPVNAIFSLDRVYNSFILFFERENFETSLKKIKEPIMALQHLTTAPLRSVHCLENLPYMRDDYSLQKIINDIEAVTTDDQTCNEVIALIIEQAIKTTGEMLRSSEGTLHLTKTSKALVQISISNETFENLQQLRDYLSHTTLETQITTSSRIDITKNNFNIYLKVAEDLIQICYHLKAVQRLNMLILDIDLLNRGLDLLNKRLEEFPIELQNHVGNVLGINTNDDVVLKEIHGIHKIKNQIICHKKAIFDKAKNKSYEYLAQIKKYLRNIKANNETWEALQNDCKLVPDLNRFYKKRSFFPNKNSIGNIKRKLESLKENLKKYTRYKETMINIDEKIQQIQDYTYEWEFIRNITRFCIEEFESRDNTSISDNVNILMNKLTKQNSTPDKETLDRIGQFIDTTATNQYKSSTAINNFKGIKELHDILIKDSENKMKNEADKHDKILSSLENRIDMLKDHLYDIPSRQQVLRYNSDKKFRTIVNMLLGDILNIFREYRIQIERTVKTTNLLTGCNLRNVLHHGDPFLEIIGQVLDDQDFSSEIITKAISIVKDSEQILEEVKQVIKKTTSQK